MDENIIDKARLTDFTKIISPFQGFEGLSFCTRIISFFQIKVLYFYTTIIFLPGLKAVTDYIFNEELIL